MNCLLCDKDCRNCFSLYGVCTDCIRGLVLNEQCRREEAKHSKETLEFAKGAEAMEWNPEYKGGQ